MPSSLQIRSTSGLCKIIFMSRAFVFHGIVPCVAQRVLYNTWQHETSDTCKQCTNR